jgi:hypothetical protein
MFTGISMHFYEKLRDLIDDCLIVHMVPCCHKVSERHATLHKKNPAGRNPTAPVARDAQKAHKQPHFYQSHFDKSNNYALNA